MYRLLMENDSTSSHKRLNFIDRKSFIFWSSYWQHPLINDLLYPNLDVLKFMDMVKDIEINEVKTSLN
jgi:hypothetical protein